MKSVQLFTIFIYVRAALEYLTKLGAFPNSILFAFTAVFGFCLIVVNIRPIVFSGHIEATGGLLIILFCLFDCFRALYSGNQEFIIASIYYSVLFVLIVCLASTNLINTDYANLRAVLYLFSIGSLVAALLDFPLGLARVFDETGIARPSGLWVNPNVMSYVCFVTACSAVAMRLHRAMSLPATIMVCAASAFAMLLAFSLAGLTALAVFLAAMAIQNTKSSPFKTLLMVGAAVVAVVFVLPNFLVNLQARILSFGSDANSLTYRVNMLLIAARLLNDPAFLVAGGGFWFEKSILKEDLHNDYARILVAGGLALLLSTLLWLFGIVWRLTRKLFRDGRVLPIWLALGISLGWGAIDSVFRTNPGSFLVFLMSSAFLFKSVALPQRQIDGA